VWICLDWGGCPQRFNRIIGYWGGGQQAELEKRLSYAVNAAGESPSTHPQYSASQNPNGAFWGMACLRPTEGEGAGPDAWIRVDEQTLIMGREPFGRVPLYWMQMDQVIWFASHLSLLLPIVDGIEISLPAVYGYSCFSYVPTPLTPVAGIFTIPTGVEQTWTFQNGAIAPPQWQRSLEWQESPQPLEDEPTAIDQLQTLLKDSIQRQSADLNQDPVGVFLSGGLDSSIVAALLVQGGVKVRAYTLDFGSAGIPEHPYAQAIADFLKIPLVRVEATPRRIRQALIPTAQALDLPFGDGVTVPLFLLGQTASQEVKVIFNGEGGDQLFAGWTNKPLIAASIYQTEHPSERDFAQQYLRTFHRFWGYESQIFQPEVYAQVKQWLPQDWLKDALDPAFGRSLLNRLRRANLMLKGAQNIHPRATRLGLAHGLDVRSPFCDLPLAQWAFRIPGELYLRGSCEKYILKRAVEPWLPPEIVWRPKRGMGVPLTSWCFDELWHELGRWLNPKYLQQEGIWQPDLATRIVLGKLGTIQGRRIGESLWLLLMWQAWRSAVLKEPGPHFSWHPLFSLPSWLGRLYLQFHRNTESW
jgi:asparagine synthase (glutamine-hydrolysing)